MKSIFGAMNTFNEFNKTNEFNKLNNSELNCVNRIKSSVYSGFIILSYGMDMLINQFS